MKIKWFPDGATKKQKLATIVAASPLIIALPLILVVMLAIAVVIAPFVLYDAIDHYAVTGEWRWL